MVAREVWPTTDSAYKAATWKNKSAASNNTTVVPITMASAVAVTETADVTRKVTMAIAVTVPPTFVSLTPYVHF